MKRTNITMAAVGVIVGLASVVLIAYTVGRNVSQHEYDALVDEVEELKAKEQEAAVVKRVSQQMEAIAYEQMKVSDMQRDRAEEQSRLAQANAARAEEQSRLAQENAARAQQQSQLAERNATVARKAAEEAREQRDAATYAKSISDTLSFRTLSRSLGTNASTMFENGEKQLAAMLAYTSWYFADKYDGNPYQEETYKALVESSKTQRIFSNEYRSMVNGVQPLPGVRDGIVAVTNYGEVELIENGKQKMLFADKGYDFRDVWLSDERVYALSYDGRLCVLSYDKLLNVVPLPADKYFKIVQVDTNTLLLAGRNLLTWFDLRDNEVHGSQQLSQELSALLKYKNKTLLFFKDGSSSEMDGTGKVKSVKSIAQGVVTATLYVEDPGLLFLGMKNGDIMYVNEARNINVILNGHVAQVTGLAYRDKILVSSSYDKHMYIWNLPKLRGEKLNVSEKEKLGTPMEWLLPCEYTSDAWGLSVCVKGNWAWHGQSDGRIARCSISIRQMVRRVYMSMSRGLTPNEWIQFVGTNVEYEKLK